MEGSLTAAVAVCLWLADSVTFRTEPNFTCFDAGQTLNSYDIFRMIAIS